VAGRRIEELRLPSGTTIVAIVRGEQLLIAHHDTLIQPEDHLILFLADKRRLLEVERLFQTGGV
jgi:trk system potassium uptake protein TrkA